MVSIASAEPIPVAAVSVAWPPVLVMLTAVPPSASLIAPAVAVSVMRPPWLSTAPLLSAMLPVFDTSVTVPAVFNALVCCSAATVTPSVSVRLILPVVPVLVADSVAIVVSIASAVVPMPVDAVSVA